MGHRWLIVALALALAGGCDRSNAGASKDSREQNEDDEDDEKDKKKDDERAEAEAEKPAPTVANTAADTEAATEPTEGLPVDDGTPPTIEEWNAQTKEVTVRGSSALNCETKMVRTWLRVSCRGKNDTGGTPTTVAVVKGGGDGKTFTFASGGVTSLVLPFVEGVDVEAVFGWTDKKMKLHVFWPRGAPEPPPKGTFSAL